MDDKENERAAAAREGRASGSQEELRVQASATAVVCGLSGVASMFGVVAASMTTPQDWSRVVAVAILGFGGGAGFGLVVGRPLYRLLVRCWSRDTF